MRIDWFGRFLSRLRTPLAATGRRRANAVVRASHRLRQASNRIETLEDRLLLVASIAINDPPAITEGDTGTANLDFTVTRTGDDLLSSIRRAAYTENGRVLFVHAGLDPNRPLSEQGDTLWWGSGYFTAIEQPYGEVTMIARGYDRTHKGLAMTQHTTTVDAGCGFGGRLAAACFDPQGKALDWIEV